MRITEAHIGGNLRMLARRRHIPTHGSREAIDAALPYLKFGRIQVLFYPRLVGDEIQEVEEFGDQKGLLVSTKRLPVTMVAGNRVLNEHEIWLHPDGSAHKYLRTATWETLEHGCTQRQYVGPATDEEIILDELLEAINFNIEETGENDSVPVLRSMVSYWARGLSRAWNLMFSSTPR